MNFTSDMYLHDADVAMKLNEALNLVGNSALTEADIEHWMEGGDAFDKVDAAVRAFMGDEMFDAIEPTARLVGVLHARLLGVNECTIGGMKFVNLLDGKQ